MQVIGRTEDGQLIIALLTEQEAMSLIPAQEEPATKCEKPSPIREIGAIADPNLYVIRFDCESSDSVTWLIANIEQEWGKTEIIGERQFLLHVRKTYDINQIGQYLMERFYEKKDLGSWVQGIEDDISQA